MDKASLFVLNIFLNSTLAFVTVVFLVECVIFLFRIPQGRSAATLRMVPLIKLPFDLFLYDLSRWSPIQGINPLNCEEGTRTFSFMCGYMTEGLGLPIFSRIQFTLPGDFTFTLADMIGHAINPLILKGFALVWVGLTLGFIIRRLIDYYRSSVTLGSLIQGSTILSRKIRNPVLSLCVKKYQIPILTSQKLVGSPFVSGLFSSAIFIPNSLSKNLSTKEYEAVLAHEVEHVRCKDNLFRLILDLIGSIFWWIPTQWLRDCIEEGQERSCDLRCKAYGIGSGILASALYKSAKYSLSFPSPLFAYHLTKHSVCQRIHLLMQPLPNRFRTAHLAFIYLARAIAFLVILPGKFWIF